MRRPTGFTDAEILPYYTDVVGLPLMRVGPAVSLLWAGEDLVFEIKTEDDPGTEATDLATAQLLPVFRSYDLAATRARFAAAGYEQVTEQRTEHSSRLWVTGPDRLLLGFEQRDEDSPFEADAEALRRWRSGSGTVLPGNGPLPDELQYLSRARRQVADLEAARAFYRDVVGLDEVGEESGAAVFAMGDTVLLELAPGGASRPLPSNRTELPDSFILRVHGFFESVDARTQAGAVWVGDQIHYETGSKLAYFADPEGLLVGIEHRTLWGSYAEDVEAERRWALQTAG
jgi:catechol 2,3-dioxygenase-like lactoylglutathione lyase family enzyme